MLIAFNVHEKDVACHRRRRRRRQYCLVMKSGYSL